MTPPHSSQTQSKRMKIRVSIVEDDRGVRETLEALIHGSEGLQCVSVHATGEEALARVLSANPDVLLMDIHLPGMSGIECARKLKAAQPRLQILMLTMYEDGDQIFKSLTAGASGYLLKRSSPEELVRAIQEVHAGGAPMSRQIARKVINHFHQTHSAAPEMEKLTAREQEILSHLAKGSLYKEIAAELGISTETVRGHLHSIYHKLHVQSRTEAVLKYLGR